MRKIILSMAMVAALALPSLAKASLLDASVFGGYTTLAMGDVNDNVDFASTFIGGTATKFSGGYYVGADAAFPIFPFLKIGPRVEYIAGSAKADGPSSKFTSDAALIPLMLGISTDWSLPLTGLAVKGGVYGGYGMGTLKSALTGGATGTQDASGGAFVGEIAAQARYSILPLLSLGLDLGYRLAKLPTMKVDAETGTFSGNVGKNLQSYGGSGKETAVDFSGVNIGATLAFNF